MTVTKIEPVAKTRFKIYIDGRFAFILYKGELSRYGIVQGGELPGDVCDKIRTEVILKRVKLKAMHLLNDMDRTESQLREKLRAGGYTQDMIDAAIEYVMSFGYVNDAAYAGRFVESRKEKKSRRELCAALMNKGVSQNIIDMAMQEHYGKDDARTAISAILEKKHFDPATATDMEKQRIMGYLTRKGFRYDDIRQLIQVSEWNA